jgi:hypothetical protein
MDHDLLSPLRDPRALAEPDWQAMEDRLHASCVAGQTAPATAVTSPIPDWRRWMAAAAAVVMTAAITFYTVPSRNVRPQPQPQPGTVRPSPGPMTRPEPGRIEAKPVPPTPPRPRRRVTRPPAAAVVEARLNEFVPLPGAFALPDFESGRIVRMEVPLTGLPAFGIDLVPDAAPTAVEADFLIGQDGLPRAIRLASTRAQ